MKMDKPLILFDGVCKFCHASVNFVIEHDRRDYFRFCPIQSEKGQSLIEQYDITDSGLSSMILIQNDKIYRKSTAALRIARHLAFPWPLMYAFTLLPAFIRDAVYDYIGGRRYQWFGKYDQCLVPDSSVKSKFIE